MNINKIRGTFSHGEFCERRGLLGTFIKRPEVIEHVTFIDHGETVYVSISRYLWQHWRGTISAAEFAELQRIVGADKFSKF
jgi:hypothetical protein